MERHVQCIPELIVALYCIYNILFFCGEHSVVYRRLRYNNCLDAVDTTGREDEETLGISLTYERISPSREFLLEIAASILFCVLSFQRTDVIGLPQNPRLCP